MAVPKVRVAGSGFTVLSFQGIQLAYLRQVDDRTPQPVAPAEEVQPMDEAVPLEIVTAQAVRGGVLSLRFYELWNLPVWAQLPGFENTNNLLDVLKRQLELGAITCRKVIRSPTGVMRARVYYNCVITDVDEGESVMINTMSLAKTLQIAYTHTNAV